MKNNQIELLILLQDILLMLKEAEEEEKQMGFKVEAREKLEKVRDDLAITIKPPLLGTFKRLCGKHRRSVVPVRNETCLGCFAKLPTSYVTRTRDDDSIFTCEQCGRILYWID
ncbi:hypothetical protein BVY01_04555 [bacterium I07]|nr:hypothetical protein BVY01_04555 [bacterium I07]